MESIRIGLLGASRIAPGAVIAPAAEIAGVAVSSVAAREQDRAQAFAKEHLIPNFEPDYAALIASEHVDLVYNGLPPSEHAKWSIAALEAGKDVLCEKPFAMNAAEAQQMIDVETETGRYLIEAFHYRFHPLFERILEVLRSGEIGPVTRIESHFNVAIAANPRELRYHRELGGGAFMDLGCYPVHWACTIMDAEPTVLAAEADWHESGVDVAMRAELEFPGGVPARLESSMSETLTNKRDAVLTVFGQQGVLTAENPVAPHDGHELAVETADGRRVETVAGKTTYFHQLQHVTSVIAGDARPVTGGLDAVKTMRVLDEVYRQAGRE